MLRAHAPVRLPGSQLEFREVRNRIREVGNSRDVWCGAMQSMASASYADDQARSSEGEKSREKRGT